MNDPAAYGYQGNVPTETPDQPLGSGGYPVRLLLWCDMAWLMLCVTIGLCWCSRSTGSHRTKCAS